jgi:transposase-like protein
MSAKRYTEEFKIEAVKQVSERGPLHDAVRGR